jgi:hypothetical protein
MCIFLYCKELYTISSHILTIQEPTAEPPGKPEPAASRAEPAKPKAVPAPAPGPASTAKGVPARSKEAKKPVPLKTVIKALKVGFFLSILRLLSLLLYIIYYVIKGSFGTL